jgi:Arabinose efflux permease
VWEKYRRVLNVPGVLGLQVLATLARIPAASAGLVLTLHVVGPLGRSYAQAGVIAAAVTVGGAVGAPWRGRAVDRFGLRLAVMPSIVVEAVVWGLAPQVSYPVLLVLAVIGGLLGLPIFSVVRQSLTALVPVGQRRTALALDSVTTELSFIVGPATIVVLATQVSTTVAMWTVGACMVAAGVALVVRNPPTRSAADLQSMADSTAPPVRDRHLLANRSLLALFAITAAATLVLSGTDIGVVSTLRALDHTTFIGVAMAAWCSGSVVGGLVYGGLHRSIPPWILLLGLCLLTIVVGFARQPWQLAVLLVPAGALCAPVVTSTVEGVTRLVPERRRGEAMGWHGSALTIGVAAGSPLAGVVIDATSPWFGFVAVGVLGVPLAIVCGVLPYLVRRRRVGELRPHRPAFSGVTVADDVSTSPPTPEQPVAAVSNREARR